MEIDEVKEDLKRLTALSSSSSHNEDAIVYAGFDMVRRSHVTAKMLLLEGRFPELQRCLDLTRAALATVMNRVSRYAVTAAASEGEAQFPPSAQGSTASVLAPLPCGSASKAANKQAVAPPASASNAEAAAAGAHCRGPPHQPQAHHGFRISNEDTFLLQSLHTRTEQLQRQLEEARRTRPGRDTNYYLKRLLDWEHGEESTGRGTQAAATAAVEAQLELGWAYDVAGKALEPATLPVPPPERGVSIGRRTKLNRWRIIHELPPLVTNASAFLAGASPQPQPTGPPRSTTAAEACNSVSPSQREATSMIARKRSVLLRTPTDPEDGAPVPSRYHTPDMEGDHAADEPDAVEAADLSDNADGHDDSSSDDISSARSTAEDALPHSTARVLHFYLSPSEHHGQQLTEGHDSAAAAAAAAGATLPLPSVGRRRQRGSLTGPWLPVQQQQQSPQQAGDASAAGGDGVHNTQQQLARKRLKKQSLAQRIAARKGTASNNNNNTTSGSSSNTRTRRQQLEKPCAAAGRGDNTVGAGGGLPQLSVAGDQKLSAPTSDILCSSTLDVSAGSWVLSGGSSDPVQRSVQAVQSVEELLTGLERSSFYGRSAFRAGRTPEPQLPPLALTVTHGTANHLGKQELSSWLPAISPPASEAGTPRTSAVAVAAAKESLVAFQHRDRPSLSPAARATLERLCTTYELDSGRAQAEAEALRAKAAALLPARPRPVDTALPDKAQELRRWREGKRQQPQRHLHSARLDTALSSATEAGESVSGSESERAASGSVGPYPLGGPHELNTTPPPSLPLGPRSVSSSSHVLLPVTAAVGSSGSMTDASSVNRNSSTLTADDTAKDDCGGAARYSAANGGGAAMTASSPFGHSIPSAPLNYMSAAAAAFAKDDESGYLTRASPSSQCVSPHCSSHMLGEAGAGDEAAAARGDGDVSTVAPADAIAAAERPLPVFFECARGGGGVAPPLNHTEALRARERYLAAAVEGQCGTALTSVSAEPVVNHVKGGAAAQVDPVAALVHRHYRDEVAALDAAAANPFRPPAPRGTAGRPGTPPSGAAVHELAISTAQEAALRTATQELRPAMPNYDVAAYPTAASGVLTMSPQSHPDAPLSLLSQIPLLTQCLCAVRLQRCWRGYVARRRCAAVRRAVAQACMREDARDTAAVCVQRWARAAMAHRCFCRLQARAVADVERRVAAEAIYALPMLPYRPRHSSDGDRSPLDLADWTQGAISASRTRTLSLPSRTPTEGLPHDAATQRLSQSSGHAASRSSRGNSGSESSGHVAAVFVTADVPVAHNGDDETQAVAGSESVLTAPSCDSDSAEVHQGEDQICEAGSGSDSNGGNTRQHRQLGEPTSQPNAARGQVGAGLVSFLGSLDSVRDASSPQQPLSFSCGGPAAGVGMTQTAATATAGSTAPLTRATDDDCTSSRTLLPLEADWVVMARIRASMAARTIQRAFRAARPRAETAAVEEVRVLMQLLTRKVPRDDLMKAYRTCPNDALGDEGGPCPNDRSHWTGSGSGTAASPSTGDEDAASTALADTIAAALAAQQQPPSTEAAYASFLARNAERRAAGDYLTLWRRAPTPPPRRRQTRMRTASQTSATVSWGPDASVDEPPAEETASTLVDEELELVGQRQGKRFSNVVPVPPLNETMLQPQEGLRRHSPGTWQRPMLIARSKPTPRAQWCSPTPEQREQRQLRVQQWRAAGGHERFLADGTLPTPPSTPILSLSSVSCTSPHPPGVAPAAQR